MEARKTTTTVAVSTTPGIFEILDKIRGFLLMRYAPGETLLWRDDRLAPCAHACYSRAANRVRNADTLLEELSIPRDLYTELFICLNFYTFKYRRTSSAERNKEVDDLNGVLLQERAKAQKIYFAELKRFCNGGGLLDGKNRCHVD